MTGDARGEAERIVHDLTASAFNGGRSHALGDTEGRQRWRVEEQGECDVVVAALAAAIEVYDKARHRQSDTRGLHVLSMPVGQWHDLGEALSALRARSGEET